MSLNRDGRILLASYGLNGMVCGSVLEGYLEVSEGLGHTDLPFGARTIERSGQCGSRVRR